MNVSDFIDLTKKVINNTKLHFAIGEKSNDEALKEFIKGDFKEWQEWQSRKNFSRKYVLSLIYLNSNEWLFGGVYRVKECKLKKGKKVYPYKYSTKLTDKGSKWIGRLIIDYEKNFRMPYTYCEKYIDDLEILELKRTKYGIMKFPGYENVNINFEDLKLIIETNNRNWKSALSNVQGVYLITDYDNGKLYVGSAYGENNLWQRWSEYVKTGHGNNEELKKLMKNKNDDYFKNFTFSILEIFKNTENVDEIIKRESYWKRILASREFGYNSN